jgi:radical SAM protein with 4Fe4S-binding SPASM domain
VSLLRTKRISRSLGGNFIVWVFLFTFGLFTALPIIYSIINSFKPINELFLFPPKFFVMRPTVENYLSLFTMQLNSLVPFERYLADCIAFGQAVKGEKLVVYRLWNQGGADEKNADILTALHAAFPQEWAAEKRGTRLADRTYLEHGDKFDWPDLNAPEGSNRVFCYGLRDQLGVLYDGTVVPCCLDHEGDLALGNIFRQEMEEILNSPRAKAIYDGFSKKEAAEPLCRRCGYARRF